MDYLLHLVIQRFSLDRIRFSPALFEQVIDLGIVITAAIITIRRCARGMEDIVINVRVSYADPCERVKMEVAFFDIAIKRAPLISAHFELDADTA